MKQPTCEPTREDSHADQLASKAYSQNEVWLLNDYARDFCLAIFDPLRRVTKIFEQKTVSDQHVFSKSRVQLCDWPATLVVRLGTLLLLLRHLSVILILETIKRAFKFPHFKICLTTNALKSHYYCCAVERFPKVFKNP